MNRDVSLNVLCAMCWHVGQMQQKMRTSTAEALSRLDVVGAVRDHRRFNYVCKVRHLFVLISGSF